MQSIKAVSVFLIELTQLIDKADSSCLIESEHLGDDECGIYGILIPYIRTGKIAVGLFKAADIISFPALCFHLSYYFTDELKSRKNVYGLNAVMACDLLCEVHRNDSLNEYGMPGHLTVLGSLAADIIKEQDPYFVACKKLILSVRSLDRNAASVSVRVGREKKIRAILCAILKAQLHSFPYLRIRIRTCREVSVRVLLLFNYYDVGKSGLSQSSRNRLKTGTVQR